MANTIDCYDQIGSTSECSDIKFKVALGVGREILRRRGLEVNARMLTVARPGCAEDGTLLWIADPSPIDSRAAGASVIHAITIANGFIKGADSCVPSVSKLSISENDLL